MKKYYDIENSVAGLVQEINEAGNNLVLDLKLNNADFETYAKVFQDRAAGVKTDDPTSASQVNQSDFSDEEIAESLHLIEMIEDAEVERRYLHDTASKLANIKINAIRLAKEADHASISARLLYTNAAKEFDAIIKIHSVAIKEARRDAFRARLKAFRSGLQSIGRGLASVGSTMREAFEVVDKKITSVGERSKESFDAASEIGLDVKDGIKAVSESLAVVLKSLVKLGECVYSAIPYSLLVTTSKAKQFSFTSAANRPSRPR